MPSSPIDFVGFRQTSVSENLFYVPTGEDEGHMYDLTKDTGHWLLYEHDRIKALDLET